MNRMMIVLLALLSGAQASPIERADTRLRPLLDTPLRDAAVCRGPDGTYYLTGTSGPDFNNGRGVRVWASKDLQNWEDKGFVWDLWKDPKNQDHKGGSAWATELYPVPGLPPGRRARGMTAPFLAFAAGRCWIAYSISGYAAGVLFADGAPVKDTFFDAKLMVEAGASPTGKSDASLFVDRDGALYLVWGGGCIAKLKSTDALRAMTTTSEGQGLQGIEGPTSFLPALATGYPGDGRLPEHGAPYGARVFLDGDRYGFIYAATTLRDGVIHEDSYISFSDKLLGPYSNPRPFIHDSGRCTVFADAQGALRVCYSDSTGQPVIASYPPPAPKPAAPGAPKPQRGEIATKIPVPKASEKPKDIKQFIEFVEPLFDHPLRDAALCFGPDGTSYLIGTEATKGKDGKLDWSNNNGIRLWKSKDQKQWQDCGYIWDCDKDGTGWHKESHLDLTCGAWPRIGRAITAPEIHYLKGTFWIVYSLNGQGIGLLKSKTGKAEGPYEDLGRLMWHGRDGSLFEDGDTVYLVWGEGFRAKLKPDLTGLDGSVTAMFTTVHWHPRYVRRLEVMGQWGSRLVKAGNWYIWTFTTRSGRAGQNSIDTLASWSKTLDGPWSEPCLMLPHGGQSTLVTTPDGKHVATVSGEDELAAYPYLPAITPVANFGWPPNQDYAKGGNPLAALRAPSAKGPIADHYAVQGLKATELDYWIGHPVLIDLDLRDVWMDRFDDGYYYVSGSFWAVKKWADQVPVYRSTDKIHWETVPGTIQTAQQLREFPGFHRAEYDKQDAELKAKGQSVQLFDIHAYQFDGNTYATVAVVRGPAYLLKSKSKSMNGPFETIARVPFGELMRDDDGSILVNTPGAISRLASIRELEQGKKATERFDIQPPHNLCFLEDCEVGLHKIDGKYMAWSTDWSGNYDMNYVVANSIEGPWSTVRVGVPHGGNGFLFRDHDRTWWYAYFNNNNDYGTRAGNFLRLNIMPLEINWQSGELVIEPKAVRVSRARLEQLGALWQTPRPQENTP